MRSIFCLLSFILFAGQALALTINVGGNVGNIPANQFLNVTETFLLTDCQSQCNNATSMINNCGTNDQCLCDMNTVVAITSCEQCMFDDLVAKFAKSTDPRAGSATALTAYAAACAGVNITIPAPLVALKLAPGWNGPFGVGLNLIGTVLAVGAGGILGGSALLLLSNLSP